ncbi:MAG: type II secretion system F family protein, partial [Planctomycetota bacterium]
ARTVWAGLRYPALLAVLLLLASVTTMSLVGSGFLIGVLVTYAAIALAAVLLVRAVRSGSTRVAALPVVGRIVAGLGELPYLETLHGLYGAGVALKAAHAAAVATVWAGAVRARLQIADQILQSGRPLREGLAEALALHLETRTLLSTGEQAGQLEDALRRALDRRREVAAREVADSARRIGQVAYALAVGACLLLIIRALSGYFALLRR